MGKTQNDKPTAPTTALSTLVKSPVLADLVAANPNPLFMVNQGVYLKQVVKPSDEELVNIIKALPDDLQESIMGLMKRMDPNRPGLYINDDRPSFTELRVFQGTGNDPSRPDSTLVGEFYLTSKTNVGSTFVGTVLALWTGRTMWPAQEDTARRPLCTSMDRKVGSKYGECSTCMHRPWREGQKQACGDDVVVLMLPRDLSDIVMIRFQRTSAKTGQQLASFLKKDLVPWQRFFAITSAKQTQGDRRWYTLEINPATGEGADVPTVLYPFCAAMERMASHDFILPGMDFIYRSAAEVAGRAGEGEDDAGKKDGSDSADDKDTYGDFNM